MQAKKKKKSTLLNSILHQKHVLVSCLTILDTHVSMS